MGYYVTCNWCGESIGHDEDCATVPVEIKRRNKSRGILDREWAKEVRPTLHFHVSELEDRDRMGLSAELNDEPDCCYMRAMAVVKGRGTETPDMGMEWRLVPVDDDVSTTVDTASTVAGAKGHGNRTPAPVQVQADADLDALLATLAPSPRAALDRAFRRADISTLEQIEAMSDDDLMAINGIGWTTRCKIRTFLADRAAARDAHQPVSGGKVTT
jgi:hypothetical protein